MPVIGTLGLLELAAQREWINLPQALEPLQQTNARLDPQLVTAVLERHKARSGSKPRVGVYLCNARVSGAITSIIGAAELTLRNAIDRVFSPYVTLGSHEVALVQSAN